MKQETNISDKAKENKYCKYQKRGDYRPEDNKSADKMKCKQQ